MKKILFIYLFCLSVPLVGQTNLPDRQAGLDSLWSVWNDKAQPDTNRLKALHKFAKKGYLYSQPDSAFYFAQLEYNFAKSNGLKKFMAASLNTQGASFFIRSDDASAMDYYTRSLTISKELGDKNGIAASLNRIGLIYNKQGDYARAIDYYSRSLTISENIEDKIGIYKALGNIGSIYVLQGDYTKAIDYMKRSLIISEEIGDKIGIATSLNNIGLIYAYQGDYDAAIVYFTRSLTIHEEIGDKLGTARSLNNIGDNYMKQGDFVSALDYFTRSLTIHEEIGDKNGIAISHINIGIIYNKQGDYTRAITYANRGLTLGQEFNGAELILEATKALYDSYKATGRNKLALEMYELYITTRDIINSEENQKEVIRQEYKYEYEKQAIADSVAYIQVQKIQEAKLEKSKIQQYALIGGVVLLVVFLAYVYNRFRVTRKQKLLISEQNKDLVIATEIAETANKELKTKSEELENFNSAMLDREMRIIELKKEANNIAKVNNMELPYPEIEDI